MNYFDVILIIISIIIIYFGYNAASKKMVISIIKLFCSSYIGFILCNIIFNKIITYLPFFNLIGKCEGIKSINIIIYKVVVYILIVVFINTIVNYILKRFYINDDLDYSVITASKVNRICGVLLSIPYAFIFLFNLILVAGISIFNINIDSKISNFIMENSTKITKNGYLIYQSELYIKESINSDNTIDTYKSINDNIIKNLTDNNIIDSKVVELLNSNNKLLGERTIKEEKEDNVDNNSNKDSSSNDGNDNYNNNNNNNENYDDANYDNDYNNDYYEEDNDIDEEPEIEEIKDYYFDEDEEIL